MDDRRYADARGAHDRRVREVADDELGAPRREPVGALGVAHERAHPHVPRAQRMHHVLADEACPACDEDRHSKFLKYRLGVGPSCPLYFEPIEDEPYGVAAGSVICMKEICPIFMPG